MHTRKRHGAHTKRRGSAMTHLREPHWLAQCGQNRQVPRVELKAMEQARADDVNEPLSIKPIAFFHLGEVKLTHDVLDVVFTDAHVAHKLAEFSHL